MSTNQALCSRNTEVKATMQFSAFPNEPEHQVRPSPVFAQHRSEGYYAVLGFPQCLDNQVPWDLPVTNITNLRQRTYIELSFASLLLKVPLSQGVYVKVRRLHCGCSLTPLRLRSSPGHLPKVVFI